MKSRLRGLAIWARDRTRAVGQAAVAHPLLALLALLVAVPCALLFWIEVRSLQGPLYGIHEWRQGWTYSVAYAFVHEHASFFYPKHAWRGHLTGIVGMEPPIYPYVVSLFMRVFGDSPVIGRVLNFALFLAAFGLQAKRIGERIGFTTALGFLVMAAFSPLVLSEFRQFQPDPAMTSLAMVAAVLLHDHGRTGDRKSFALGLAAYTLALLTKPIAVAIFPAMFLFAVMGEKRPTWRAAALKLASFALPLGLMFAWDKWANVLVARYMDGVPMISIDHDPAQMWAEMKNVGARRLILLGLVENWVTHVSLFPAVLIGVPYSLRRETRSWGVPLLAWVAGVIVISLAFSSRYWANWYYMLLFAPPFLFFGALGLGRVFDVVGLTTRDPLTRGVALAVVLAALFVAPQLDVVPWDRIEHVPEQLAVHVRHRVSGSDYYWIAIAGALLTAGAALALRDKLDRVPSPLLALLLAVASGWAMVIPYKDLKQTVRFYTTESDWEAGYEDSRALRKAVDRYSKANELFLMSGSNPALLVRARRVGYADDPGWIDRMTRAFYVSNGVRFFVWIPEYGGIPATMHGAQHLASGPRWQLFCIDPKGCPPRKRSPK